MTLSQDTLHSLCLASFSCLLVMSQISQFTQRRQLHFSAIQWAPPGLISTSLYPSAPFHIFLGLLVSLNWSPHSNSLSNLIHTIARLSCSYLFKHLLFIKFRTQGNRTLVCVANLATTIAPGNQQGYKEVFIKRIEKLTFLSLSNLEVIWK